MPETKARIQTYLPDAERQTQQSRFAGFAQTGVRWQSNANFSPSNGTVTLSGVQLGLPATQHQAVRRQLVRPRSA